jgi:hypothetical protein
MLKGYQRKLIMIRTKESSIFESAFFILRQSSCQSGKNGEMINEANKILNESNLLPKKKNLTVAKHILIAAGIGFFLGAAIVGIIWLAVAL